MQEIGALNIEGAGGDKFHEIKVKFWIKRVSYFVLNQRINSLM